MNNVLIDSSVWIDYFKRNNAPVIEKVNTILDEDRAVLCGMVELEILQGLCEHERSKIQNLFQVLHFIDATRQDFRTAGQILNQLRSKGITIPSSDCLIATQCIRNKILLFTLDNDFKHIPDLKLINP